MSQPMSSNQGFRLSSDKGFHVGFKNGYTVSVQFGPGNYGDHYDCSYTGSKHHPGSCGAQGALTVEVAVWKHGGDGLIAMPEFGGNTVGGYYTPEKVLALMQWAEAQP